MSYFFNRFVNRYVITGTLLAVDPIHIGNSGNDTLEPVDVDASVLKDSAGRAVIPGSSLKGVARSLFESVIRAASGSDDYDKKFACDVLDEKKCCTAEISNDEDFKAKKGAEKAQLAWDNSCVACRLFGGREIAGRLMFKDSIQRLKDGEKPLYEYRDGVGIDRETGSAKRGAKFDYEIVPAGTEFDFCLIAENLDEEQEKYLDFVINRLRGGDIAVGGKTTRGLGRIKLCGDNYEEAKATATAPVDELKRILASAKGAG
jgi:CRISPR-associated RAMP protein (TIGR02581 family)